MHITPDSVFSRNDALPDSFVDDEVILLSITNSKYYGMDSLGSRIWSFLQKPIKIGRIVDKIVEEYSVSREDCERDVLAYLSHLAKEGLVKQVE